MAEFDPSWEGEDVREWRKHFTKDDQQQEVVLRRRTWRDWDEGEKISGVTYELDATDFLATFVTEGEFRAAAEVMQRSLIEG